MFSEKTASGMKDKLKLQTCRYFESCQTLFLSDLKLSNKFRSYNKIKRTDFKLASILWDDAKR